MNTESLFLITWLLMTVQYFYLIKTIRKERPSVKYLHRLNQAAKEVNQAEAEMKSAIAQEQRTTRICPKCFGYLEKHNDAFCQSYNKVGQ